MKKLILTLLGALAVYVLVAVDFGDSTHLVNGVYVAADETGNSMRVEFSAPARVLDYFPKTPSDIVQIRLRPVAGGSYREVESLIEQFVEDRVRAKYKLEDVRFEGSVPGGPYLVLKFSSPVRFSVAEAGKLLGVVVTFADVSRSDDVPEHS